MKPIGPVAVFAVLFSLPVAVLAQGAKPAADKPASAPAQPAAKPAAAPVQPVAKPAEPAAQPAVKLASGSAGRSRANEDARACLELATNMEVHQCAEKYR